MIDTHAHLYFDRFDDDRADVIRRAKEVGVTHIINIGIDPDTSLEAIRLAGSHPGLRAAAGIHPSSVIDDVDAALDSVARLARKNEGVVVAIGEIGLDYHWKEVDPKAQRARLERQLDLALDLGLPVIYHCRDALEDLLSLLEGRSPLPPGVFHCFSGGPEEARRALELGYHVSFAGNVTYPRAEGLRAAAAAVPPEKLLLETDAPFLPPQPCRGRRNEPAFVRHSRDALAAILGLSPEELEQLTDETARRLFGL